MKKSSRFTGLVLSLLGAMVPLNNLGKPRVEALHGSDVWGLVASGICLGIGFVGLMGRLSFGTSVECDQRGKSDRANASAVPPSSDIRRATKFELKASLFQNFVWRKGLVVKRRLYILG